MKKKGWEIKTLGEVCEVINGYAFNSKFFTTDSNFIPLIRIRDIKRGYSETYYNAKYSSDFIIKKGDYLIGMDGEFNIGEWGSEDALLNQRVCKLKANEAKVFNKFIYYFIPTKLKEIEEYTAFVTVKHLSSKQIREIPIPVPPLKEQKEIVSKLDKGFELIDRLKENAEKNLENAKELFQSALREELSPKKGWETKKLKEIGNATTGQTPPTKDKDNFGDFIPFVKPADFLNGKLDYNNDGLSEKGMKYSRISEKGATLMVCIGATIGKTAFTEQNVTSNQQINSIYPNKDFFPKYIYYLLISKDFYNQVLKNASQATLPIINKSKWENLSVSFPSNIKQQEEIVTKLDKIKAMCEELEENYKKSVLLCEELKQGLLREVFED